MVNDHVRFITTSWTALRRGLTSSAIRIDHVHNGCTFLKPKHNTYNKRFTNRFWTELLYKELLRYRHSPRSSPPWGSLIVVCLCSHLQRADFASEETSHSDPSSVENEFVVDSELERKEMLISPESKGGVTHHYSIHHDPHHCTHHTSHRHCSCNWGIGLRSDGKIWILSFFVI